MAQRKSLREIKTVLEALARTGAVVIGGQAAMVTTKGWYNLCRSRWPERKLPVCLGFCLKWHTIWSGLKTTYSVPNGSIAGWEKAKHFLSISTD
jgi:hypothetical protein